MSQPTPTDPIDDVAPGDLVVVDHGEGERPYRVVHKADTDTGFLVTFEGDDAETFQFEMAAGTRVIRSLESKWESAESPTPHSGDAPA